MAANPAEEKHKKRPGCLWIGIQPTHQNPWGAMRRTAAAVRLFRYAGVSCGCGAVAASKLSSNVEKAGFFAASPPTAACLSSNLGKP